MLKEKELTPKILEKLCEMLRIGCVMTNRDVDFNMRSKIYDKVKIVYKYAIYPSGNINESMTKLLAALQGCKFELQTVVPQEAIGSSYGYNSTQYIYRPNHNYYITFPTSDKV